MPEHLWNRIPIACHQVADAEEADLRRLLANDMVVLIPESDLPRNRSGGLMLRGLFCVPKNTEEDRVIFDRRPENATMGRLNWARLPSEACYTHLLLQQHQYLRGSGEDLRNFFYNLKLPDNWVRYNAFGKRVSREVLVEHGRDHRAFPGIRNGRHKFLLRCAECP